MNVKLGPKFEQFVAQKVSSGEYLTVAEVIRDALLLLQEKDKIHQLQTENLRHEIEQGYEAAQSGRFSTYSEKRLPKLLAKIQRQGRARLASQTKSAG